MSLAPTIVRLDGSDLERSVSDAKLAELFARGYTSAAAIVVAGQAGPEVALIMAPPASSPVVARALPGQALALVGALGLVLGLAIGLTS